MRVLRDNGCHTRLFDRVRERETMIVVYLLASHHAVLIFPYSCYVSLVTKPPKWWYQLLQWQSWLSHDGQLHV